MTDIHTRPNLSDYRLAQRLKVAALDPEGEIQYGPILRDIAEQPGDGGALALLLALTHKLANTSIQLVVATLPEVSADDARRLALIDARQELAALTAEAGDS